MNTKFFMFDQNNSYGIFDVDENVCHRVVIEANDKYHASDIFNPLIKNQSGSCPCCGDRWSYWIDELDSEELEKENFTFDDIIQYCQDKC